MILRPDHEAMRCASGEEISACSPSQMGLNLHCHSAQTYKQRFGGVSHKYGAIKMYSSGSGGFWRGGMADDLAFDKVDHQFGDVGGMISHPLEVFRYKAQANGA